MDKDKKILGVTPNVFFLGLASFFNDFSAEMVQSVMPVFITSVLGAPAFFVGLIEGVAEAVSSILKVFSGWFSDRIGKRKLPAVLGYVLSTSTRPLLSLTTHFSQVFGLRVVDRIGKGFRDAPRDALLAETADEKELAKSYGFHRSLDTLGATLGPLSAFFLLPFLNTNYRHLFIIAFVLGLGAILSFIWVKDKKIEAGAKKAVPKLNLKLFKTNKKFIAVVAAIFVFGLGTLPILLVLLKGEEAGLPGGYLPFLYFIYSLAFVLTAVPLGKLADRIGERLVIAGGFFAAAIAYAALARTAHPAVTILLFAVLGIYSSSTDGVARALAARNLAPEILATGQGFLNMSLGISSLIAGIVGGWLWTRFGSEAAFIYAAAFSVLGLMLFLRMTKSGAEDGKTEARANL
jgi:MFS family permease